MGPFKMDLDAFEGVLSMSGLMVTFPNNKDYTIKVELWLDNDFIQIT